MSLGHFDDYADEYDRHHANSVRFSGDPVSYFAEYKIARLAKELPSISKGVLKILDFGGGVGNSLPFFTKYFPNAQVTICDTSEGSLSKASLKGNVETRHISADVIPASEGEFDIVFSAGVFHHIPPESHLTWLNEIFRVTKKNGYFFLFDHNPNNPLTLKAVNDCEFDDDAILVKAKTLRGLFQLTGFKRVEIKYTLFFPRFLRYFRPLEKYLSPVPIGGQYFVSGSRID